MIFPVNRNKPRFSPIKHRSTANQRVHGLICRLLLPLLALVTTHCFAELPLAPQYIGEISRNHNGDLITTTKTPAITDTLQQTTPQSATVDTKPKQASIAKPLPPAAQNKATTSSTNTVNTPPECDPNALTCIEIISTGKSTQTSVPVTFGQPFKPGDLAKSQRLTAREGQNPLPLQIDEESSLPDGSTGFAVLSTRLSNLKPGEKRTINLYRESVRGTSPAVRKISAPNLDITLEATIHTPQISQLIFGNRQGTTPGTPFEAGEQITLQLGNSASERYSLSLTPPQAGGGFPNLTRIAEAFRDQINKHSPSYRAYKIGEGGGFEKLWITSKAADAPAFTVNILYAGKAKIATLNQQEYHPPKKYTATPGNEFAQPIKAAHTPRLQGAINSEYTLVSPFIENNTRQKHPQLTARLHSRFFANDERIRNDIVLENNWAYEAEPGNLTYELTIKQGTKTLLRQEAFTHYHHARWHNVLWTGGEAPLFQVRHHMPYFLQSKATWNYNLALPIPESVLAEEHANLSKRNTGPMSSVFITPYFPTTGGRPEIGPLPRWTALYLITQDPRAEASMLANADAAAGIPIHYRDQPTDQPVNLDRHPGLALVAGNSSDKDKPPTINNRETHWSPDTAHQASYAFIPYLITGDNFYLDEIMFWSAWNLFAVAPDYRDYGKGLINRSQIRAQAWALRAIAESAYAIPDTHPEQTYYRARLTNNLAWYVNNYPKNSTPDKVSPLGAIQQPDNLERTAPWQNDFMALVVGLIAQRGDPLAKTYFDWLSKFTVGRFINEQNGFCRFHAPSYWIRMRDKTGLPYKTWQGLYQANWPNEPICSASKSLDGNVDSASGYVAYAAAALALAFDLNTRKADQAYYWLLAQSEKMDMALSIDPTWAIISNNKKTALGNNP